MDKEERKQLEKEFREQLKKDLHNTPKDKFLAIVYLLAFLSVISAIAFLIWMFG